MAADTGFSLHGVVFVFFVQAPQGTAEAAALPGPGREIVSASRLRDQSIQLQHIML